MLSIQTVSWSRGGIRSTAAVFWSDGQFRSTLLFGDFNKTVAQSPKIRATQKAIDTQHATAFPADVVTALTAEAKAFYAGIPVEA